MRPMLLSAGLFCVWFIPLCSCHDLSISSISRDEYAVYSAFLSQWHFYHPPVDEPGGARQVEVEIVGTTMSYASIHRGDDKAVKIGPWDPVFKKLGPSIFYDYESKADAPIDFKRICVPGDLTIEVIDAAANRRGYTLSRVGFNENKDVAAFFVKIPRLGGSWFVFNLQDHRWRLVDEVAVWVE